MKAALLRKRPSLRDLVPAWCGRSKNPSISNIMYLCWHNVCIIAVPWLETEIFTYLASSYSFFFPSTKGPIYPWWSFFLSFCVNFLQPHLHDYNQRWRQQNKKFLNFRAISKTRQFVSMIWRLFGKLEWRNGEIWRSNYSNNLFSKSHFPVAISDGKLILTW